MSPSASVIVGSIGLALAASIATPAARAFYQRIVYKREEEYDADDLYEDNDGVATEKSQAEFSTLVTRSVCLGASLGGFFLSVAAAVIDTTDPNHVLGIESWLAFGIWALLVFQSAALFYIRSPTARLRLGLHAATNALIVIVSLSVENGLLVSHGAKIDDYRVHAALIITQLVLALVLFISGLSIPRRPQVFDQGRPVDGQFTTSVIGRYTFHWASSLLAYARQHPGLKMEELPTLADYTRSDFLQTRYNADVKFNRLWKTMFWNFKWSFLQQFTLVVIVSILAFGPQYAMYQLLKALERRIPGEAVDTSAWLWVFALGLAIVVSSWIESWLFFIIWADLGIPIRALISILVFMKSTRRKDVKGVSNAKEKTAQQAAGAEGEAINSGAGPQGADSSAKVESNQEANEDEDAQKSRQMTINLVGVDAKRISDFCSYAYIFPGTVTKLIVSMWFLGTLIGWKALLAGLFTFSLTIPVNIYASLKYNNAQGELMKLRDQKMAVVTEALQGIRQIKFSALEKEWEKRIGDKRREELATQRRVFLLDTCLITLWITGPVALSAVCLTVYTLINKTLLPSVAFTTIAVLASIEFTLAVIPELSTDAIDAWVSLNRIEKYMNAPEKIECTTPAGTISFENAAIAWPADEDQDEADRFVLRDVNVAFPNKELSVISGKTGSGKSLMLAAILGEVDKIAGSIKVPRAPPVEERYDSKATRGNWIIDSSIAFVAQIPWIESASIKDNILFNLPFDAGRYKKVVQVCALEKDLDMLPDGELTDIGANGINLSGGQRWRISFARALYSRAGILILDDVFSAVDAHVGRQLFDDALTGELGVGRTRILVTHHVGLVLPKTKYSVLLGEGTIAHAGYVSDLKKSGSLDDFLTAEKEEQQLDEELLQHGEANGDALHRVTSRRSERSVKVDDGAIDTRGKGQPKKFTEEEKRETGSIKLAVYREYISTSGGLKIWIPMISLFVSYMLLGLSRSYWVSIWTRSYETDSALHNSQRSTVQYIQLQQPMVQTSSSDPSDTVWYYLGVYIGLSFAIVVIGSVRYASTFVASLRASRILFEKLSFTVLRAPLRWLDTVPVGRVLNRFTADFNVLDSRIANNMGFSFYTALELLGITIAGVVVSPFVILFAVFLTCIAFYISMLYLRGAREVRRLESNAKSPVFEQFGSLLSGVGTVRAFDKTEEYIKRMFVKIDTHTNGLWHIWLFNRWMGFRLNLVGAAFAIVLAAIIVGRRSIDASLAGFALTFALQYTSSIIWTLRSYSTLELDMNATERIIEYSRLETEHQGGNEPPAAWPAEGKLELDGVVAGYAPDLPPVLKGLSFVVEKNQRVGVVGRTGAGKSSLTLAIFRFLEAREGSIRIDNVDISKINLHDLRSRLAIIPQDPVLFSGTVRSNLDAFDHYTDAELRDALERVHLLRSTDLASEAASRPASRPMTANAEQIPNPPPTAPPTPNPNADKNINIFTSLSSRISEGGLNLSQGQRQLLCLARAIVSRPKIMVLDEATSAVDMATDVLIQRSIREEFEDSTLLVIAHRLTTIADFDKILVMSEGRAVEFDSPANLLEKKGAFWEMVGQSGEKDRLEEIILGAAAGEGSSQSGGEGNGEGSSRSSGHEGTS